MMASRQAMMDAGLFDERFRRCEDFDLWLRMSFRGAKMDLVPEVGVEHRIRPDGLASDPYLLKLGRLGVYEKTLSTLPLSTNQKQLVQKLIALTDGLIQMDLVKRNLQQGRYQEARLAASKAVERLQNSRSRRVAWVVQVAPWALRSYLNLREGKLTRKPRQFTNAGSQMPEEHR